MAGAGYKLFNTGDVLTAAQVNTYLQEQVVMVFANATARTTALSGVLSEGMVSYLKDTNATEVYDGSAWVAIGNSGDITGVTAGTGLTGGGTSGSVTVSLDTPVSATNGGTAQTTYATGDILYASATNTLAKRTIGTSNQGLIVSGGVPTWGATPQSVMTTTGDLLYASSANTPARLGIGTTGQVLTVSGGVPTWAAASGGSTFAGVKLYKSTTQSITNASWNTVTWDSETFDTDAFHSTSTNTSRISIPTGKGGKYLIQWTVTYSGNSTGGRNTRLLLNANLAAQGNWVTSAGSDSTIFTNTAILNLSAGEYLEVQVGQTSGGSLNILGTETDGCTFSAIYLGA